MARNETGTGVEYRPFRGTRRQAESCGGENLHVAIAGERYRDRTDRLVWINGNIALEPDQVGWFAEML
jgi:hypothetical protein